MSFIGANFDYDNDTMVDLVFEVVIADTKTAVLGPIFAPLPINAVLLGILTYQVTTYFGQYGRTDSKWTKWLVASLMVLSLATNGCVLSWAFNVFITHYGHYYTLFLSSAIVPFYGLLGVQFYLTSAWYAHKAWRLYENRWWVPAIIMTFATVSLVAAIATMVSLGSVRSILEVRDSTKTKVNALLYIYGTITTDCCITGLILAKILKSRTGWSQTDRLIRRLTLLTMESQAPPTIFCLIVAIHFSCTFGTELAYPYLMISGNVYAIAILFSLTSRAEFRDPYERERTRAEGNTYIQGERSRIREHTQVRVNIETHVEVSDIPVLAERKRHAGLRDEGGSLDAYDMDKRSDEMHSVDSAHQQKISMSV